MKSSGFSHVNGPVLLRHRARILLILIRWSLTKKFEDASLRTVLRSLRRSYGRHEVGRWHDSHQYSVVASIHSSISGPVASVLSLPLSSMSPNSSYPIPELPTELLIRIFAHLQVADLLSVQHACRRFYNVVSDSIFLQYILHAEINHLEAILPLDVSLDDRIALLKHHETAWKNLELNALIQFVVGEGLRAHSYILQDGYLIYKAVIVAAITQTPRYGYIDLYSISDQPNAEIGWTLISLGAIRPVSDIIFAVDQDLVVVLRF